MADRKIRAVITAEDRATPTLKRVGSSITSLGAIAAAVGAVQIGPVNGIVHFVRPVHLCAERIQGDVHGRCEPGG